ncbi:protein phosphatase inhibitor 2-like isoform X1 [Bidens hawaiensis]|uniref:protein phosphatase inhibitor 2-like isoform X1 n=1 Tax=Bidens hawaiensis TaxID=980011 RepID=UPI00404A55DE
MSATRDLSSSRSVRWDEAKLSEIEANKPVRQKITEPKTPYHRMTDVDGSLSPARSPSYSERNDESVHSVFNDMVSDNNSQQQSGWADDDTDAMNDDNEDSEIGRSSSFKDQRRAHYDEFHKVRELMRNGSLNEPSNDDDENLYEDCETPSSLAVCVEDKDVANVEELPVK